MADICDEYGIRPTVFYRWQKQFFERGAEVLRRGEEAETKKLRRKVERLEEKLSKKDEVLGELMEEYVALKKHLGHPEGHLGAQRDPRPGGGVGREVVEENGNRCKADNRMVGCWE